MKKINLILIVVAVIISFTACEDDPLGPFVELGNGPVFSAPTGGSTYVLTEATEDDTLTTFVWSDADFGFISEVSYTLEMSAAGTSFAEKFAISSSNKTESAFTEGFLNNILLSNSFTFGVAHDLEFRIMATIHEDVDTLYSDVINMTITPFEKIIIYPTLYVPGDYMVPNWSPVDAAGLYSLKSNNKYEGYRNLEGADNNFKFTDSPDWDNGIYGDADASGTTGTIDQAGQGNNIYIAGAGYYKMNVDLTAFTYTYLKTDFGIVGSAVPPYDWATDVVMTYDPVAGTWSVTEDLVAGALKFRANGSWDAPNPNYGSDDANGIANEGGSDIPIASDGNYTITLDLRGPLYRYTVTKN